MTYPIEPIFSETALQERIAQLGKAISRDYQGRRLHLVVVLNGAAFFGVDLAKRLSLDCHLYFIRAKSYQGTRQQELVEFELPLDIAGQEVLVVEDIVDSGKTILQLWPHLQAMRPKSLKLCALLHKHLIPPAQLPVDYLGFDCPNQWVVGYGLDHDGLYRNLPYIGILPKEMQ